MRYYVTADVHGYFRELKTALQENGFFEDKEPHKLIICGDLYDRGSEALPLQEFILELLAKDEVILIRGNHEDLTLRLLNEWHRGSYRQDHHHWNGTMDTVCQLTNSTLHDVYHDSDQVCRKLMKNDYIQKIIPATVDYYETRHYIFTHGWIPCTPEVSEDGSTILFAVDDWRHAGDILWNRARWINGMEAAHNGAIEKGKTIVCGHWDCSFGHCHYKGDGGEFDNSPNFNPYYDEGIIALDACTPTSGKVNCIVIEDEELC